MSDGRDFTGVYLFFCTISQKPLQLASSNSAQKSCPTTSPGKPMYFWVKTSKVKVTRDKKQRWREFLHFC